MEYNKVNPADCQSEKTKTELCSILQEMFAY